MKLNDNAMFAIIAVAALISITLCVIFGPQDKKDCNKVDLPEEYKEITRDTPIEGHFEGDVLVIEFKH